MRDIKFRGKRLDNGEWIFGSYVITELQDRSVCHGIVPFPACENAEEVDPNTVGQYTGLKDKNGKEIYEGDIVECDVNMTLPTDRMRIAVVWCGAGFVISDKNNVVIGNINDNPALIKNQEDEKKN